MNDKLDIKGILEPNSIVVGTANSAKTNEKFIVLSVGADGVFMQVKVPSDEAGQIGAAIIKAAYERDTLNSQED